MPLFGRDKKKDLTIIINGIDFAKEKIVNGIGRKRIQNKQLFIICVMITELAGYALMAKVRKTRHCLWVTDAAKIPVMAYLSEEISESPENIALNWNILAMPIIALGDHVVDQLIKNTPPETGMLSGMIVSHCELHGRDREIAIKEIAEMVRTINFAL